MLELAGDRVDPEYLATSDPRVGGCEGGLFIGIPAGAYLRRVGSDGSPAFSLDELRGHEERLRLPERNAGTGSRIRHLPPPGGTILLRASLPLTAFWLPHFAHAPRSVGIDYLPRGQWVKLVIPADGAADIWHASVSAPVEAGFRR
jgi:hypothetical protein